MLQNLLADELTFPIAVGRQPDPPRGSQRIANGLELGRLVAACSWAGAVQRVRPQEHGGPAFPGRHHVFGLLQIEQMALGGQDGAITAANRRADVRGLAGLLRDDKLIRHGGWECSPYVPFTICKRI